MRNSMTDRLLPETIDFTGPFPRLSRRLRLGIVGGGRVSELQATAARLTGAGKSSPARCPPIRTSARAGRGHPSGRRPLLRDVPRDGAGRGRPPRRRRRGDDHHAQPSAFRCGKGLSGCWHRRAVRQAADQRGGGGRGACATGRQHRLRLRRLLRHVVFSDDPPGTRDRRRGRHRPHQPDPCRIHAGLDGCPTAWPTRRM